MASIYFLGTCSGTEPMQGMHHTSTVIAVNGQYYWFDAGECSSHTAFLLGLDPLQTRAIFLSHMHIDHTGGLANVFHCINKMIALGKGEVVKDNTVQIYAPDLDLLNAVKCVSCNSMDYERHMRFRTVDTRIFDGVIHEDENLRVTACHNRHLREDGSNGWHAYSFLVEVEGKRIVLSGDVGAPAELEGLLAGGCDLLVMETGHHKVADVCEFAKRHALPRLRFTHHGREIINDREGMQALIDTYPLDIKLAHDGMVETI